MSSVAPLFFLSSSGRETAPLCPGNKPCLHDTTEVRFLKTGCQDFLNSGLKYQHLSPPSPEIDYISIRVELREQATRALLEVRATSRREHGGYKNIDFDVLLLRLQRWTQCAEDKQLVERKVW